MSKSSIAKDLLDEIDERVELIEDRELTRFERLKRRYWSKKVIFGYAVGGNVTLLQVTGGKKFLLWLALKFPTSAAFFAKVWGFITAAVTGAFHFGG